MKYLLSLLCALTLVQAQELTSLMPRDTFFALGIQNGEELLAEFPELQAEWENLNIVEALLAVSGVEASQDELRSVQENINNFAFLNHEAWLSASASSYNPLPAILLLAQMDETTLEEVSEMLAEAEPADSFTEGDYSFYQAAGEEDDVQLFYALADDVLLLSSSPDVLRGSLRQVAGSEDPSFVDSDGYNLTLTTMPDDAYLYSYIDYAQVATLANPYVQGFGVDKLVARVVQGFETAGVSAGYAHITEREGERVWLSRSIQALNANAGDGELYTLLTPESTLSLDALQFMPADALSYGQNVVDLPAWWDYIDGIAATLPWLDGSLDDTLELFLDVSLKDDFFSWMGEQVAVVVLEPAEVTTPGVAVDSLLGDAVYIFEVDNTRAARNRLPKFLSSLAEGVSTFTDPMGKGEAIEVDDIIVAGVDAQVYQMSDGISLVYALTDGYMLLATTQEGLERSIMAYQGDNLASVLKPDLPANATSYGYSDAAASLRSSSAQITSQMQLMAGIAGSENLDFDTIEEASAKLEQFFDTLASYLGESQSYSYADDGILYNEAYTVLK